MALTADFDLVRNTSISLSHSRLGVLQYGRIGRSVLVEGLAPVSLDSNGTDPTVTTRAVNFVRGLSTFGLNDPHPDPQYEKLTCRDYSFSDTGSPNVGEVTAWYIFAEPINPDYTIDCDSWVEQIESQIFPGPDGIWNKTFKVGNYYANWKDPDADTTPPNNSDGSTAKKESTVFGVAPIFIPRRKWVVTKQQYSSVATTVQASVPTYEGKTNSTTFTIGGVTEAIGTVLCSRIATSTEPYLGRSTITCEFLVRPEGWKSYLAYSAPLFNGKPGNVWRAHKNASGVMVAANGMVEEDVQPAVNLNTLLTLF